ncbi:hypothetical protein ACG83_10615 [Frankia sp. R43]|uniref:hypothetical protein n=1 Tax=Frankia sp. R43 TaxID=269536 RepID=UPI0006CA3EA9|nr:hypothetical protein [Frankia sp. R43]KPM55724.1 hypothetical protein ACG83_10615 [Frankia sp. R43]
MAGDESELAALVAAVNAAREREKQVRDAAHLDYCRAIRSLVKYEEDAHGKHGAQRRVGRHLNMSAQNVGTMLDQLYRAETGQERPKKPRAARAAATGGAASDA